MPSNAVLLTDLQQLSVVDRRKRIPPRIPPELLLEPVLKGEASALNVRSGNFVDRDRLEPPDNVSRSLSERSVTVSTLPEIEGRLQWYVQLQAKHSRQCNELRALRSIPSRALTSADESRLHFLEHQCAEYESARSEYARELKELSRLLHTTELPHAREV